MVDEELFLKDNDENGDFNQYWYSPSTIRRIVDELIAIDGKVAFLSTPSLFFSVPQSIREKSYVFDYDKKWSNEQGFVFFDFNDPSTVPAHLFGSFDVVVIDPPFITSEVWIKYADIAKTLMPKTGGKVILTTILENAALLNDLLGVSVTAFQPSIPNLVYQYQLYTNYPSHYFNTRNPEIPE